MNNIALKKTVTKIIAVIFLCIGVVFLSAFTYPKESRYLTRLDMAILMEEILNDASISVSTKTLPSFSDISQEQHKSIEKVLKLKIMNGYPDNTFRPNAPMHNMEVVSYLQRLTGFLRKKNPNSYSAKQLFRFLSYNDEPSIAFEYSPLNFSKEFENPNELTSKKVAKELFNKITNNKNEEKCFTISGQVIDSISNKPVENAFISANCQAEEVKKNGFFSFKLSSNTKTADIFVAAEGYQPTEIRKDLNFSRNMTIRLRPVSVKED
jgi:hypothetical protein